MDNLIECLNCYDDLKNAQWSDLISLLCEKKDQDEYQYGNEEEEEKVEMENIKLFDFVRDKPEMWNYEFQHVETLGQFRELSRIQLRKIYIRWIVCSDDLRAKWLKKKKATAIESQKSKVKSKLDNTPWTTPSTSPIPTFSCDTMFHISISEM